MNHPLHLLDAVLTAETQVNQLSGRHGSCPFGRERSLSVQRIVDINHPTMLVGADGDAAAHVGHYQVHILISLVDRRGILARDGFAVESMED